MESMEGNKKKIDNCKDTAATTNESGGENRTREDICKEHRMMTMNDE